MTTTTYKAMQAESDNVSANPKWPLVAFCLDDFAHISQHPIAVTTDKIYIFYQAFTKFATDI